MRNIVRHIDGLFFYNENPYSRKFSFHVGVSMAEAKKKVTRSQKSNSKKTSAGQGLAKKTGSKKSATKATTKKKKANKKPIGTCFVLMPFKEPFDTYYTLIIKPAVIAAGLEPLRGDSLFRPSPIMGDIWSMIQDAKVLVAELTEKNANVFYELGLGHAIGKPIVLMSETIDDVPFDLQPLRVILYDKDDPAWGVKLRAALIASLSETISDSASAVPPMFRKKVKSQAPEESGTSTRLSALERQLALLRNEEFLPVRSSKYSSLISAEFKGQLRKVNSREEAAEVTRKALMRGLPELVVRKILRTKVPAGEAEEVLALAIGSRDLFSS
jgi:hypothetical protein